MLLEKTNTFIDPNISILCKLQVINGFQQIHCSGSVHKSSCPRRGKQDLFEGLWTFQAARNKRDI